MVVSLVIFREIITADPNPHFWIVHTNICAKQIYMQNKHLNYVVLLIFRSRLYEENSVRTIAKEISASQTPKSVKIYAYKNGEGREKEGRERGRKGEGRRREEGRRRKKVEGKVKGGQKGERES